MPLRFAHLSDVHIFCPRARWGFRDWFNRRLAGWLNHRFLPRAHEFKDAVPVLRALIADVHTRRPDLLIFSGDATALGFEEEVAQAAELLRVGDPDFVPGLTIPGNHDYYTEQAVQQRHFERHFAPWLQGECVDDAPYPFARKVGDVHLIAVNSARPNRWFWDATGFVGRPQLDRLERLLARPHIRAGRRILVTHYPICLANGGPETRDHGLLDLPDLLAVAQAGGVSLWLHGHRHHPYEVFTGPLSTIPSICAGSGTQRKLWSYGEYVLDGPRLEISRRTYDEKSGQFRTSPPVSWQLAPLSGS